MICATCLSWFPRGEFGGNCVWSAGALCSRLAKYLLCKMVFFVMLLAGCTSEIPLSSVKICWRAARRACPGAVVSPKSLSPGGAPGIMAKGCVLFPVQKIVWPATDRIGGNAGFEQEPLAMIASATRPAQPVVGT